MTEVAKITSDMLNTNQAATYAKVTRSVILGAVKRGELESFSVTSPTERKSNRRQHYFKKTSLRSWLEAHPPRQRKAKAEHAAGPVVGPSILTRLEGKLDQLLEEVAALRQMWS